MRTKGKYDPDFKEEAVRLVLKENLTIREVERRLGISNGVLTDWIKKNTVGEKGLNHRIKD